jgi:thiol-disulfide isomerase/thioredoxin
MDPKSGPALNATGALATLALAALVVGGLMWGMGRGQSDRQAREAESPSGASGAGAGAINNLDPGAAVGGGAASDEGAVSNFPTSSAPMAQPDTAGLSTGIVVEGRASLGEPAPEFALETPQGGPIALSDYAGQPILVNFWATWCAPCRAEMPFLEALHAKHSEAGLVILGVDVQESSALVLPFLDQLGLTFPIALDLNGDTAFTYRVSSYPTSFLVDREGRIVNIRRGAFANEADLSLSVAMIMPEIQ